jgi:hypothetical protein
LDRGLQTCRKAKLNSGNGNLLWKAAPDWTDEQDAGTYRLKRREDEAYFGYSLGPQSWKRILQPPIQKLWHAERHNKGFSISPEQSPSPSSFALIGVRTCELRAMEVQDKTFLEGDFIDSGYESRRDALVVVEQAGTPHEQVMPADTGFGFLWRLHSYWRFQQSEIGVCAECRAISLTRDIPKGLGWIVEPIIYRLPRESLINTLKATREAVLSRVLQVTN